METIRHKLIASILDGDRVLANSIIDGFALIHGYEASVSQLLEPVLCDIGDMWAKDDGVTLAQGYVAGIIAEDVLSKFFSKENSPLKSFENKGTVVIGNIEDDYHSLGRKLVIAALHMSGWQVCDLGNDILAETFVDKACELDARVIAVSAMMYTTAMNIKKIRKEIDRRGLGGHIKLAAGGAVFILRPELLAEVGGDGTARNAFRVPDLIDELWEKSLRKGD
jgi:methanogenic corrinoid protein MtbC1